MKFRFHLLNFSSDIFADIFAVRRFFQKRFFVLAAAAWLLGAGFFPSLAQQKPAAQTRKVKTPTATPKTTISKPAPKTVVKTTVAPKSSPPPIAKVTPKSTPKPTSPAAPRFILNGFNVFVRANPTINSENVEQLKFGTVIRSLERSAASENINGKTGYWHKINLSDGKSGWVFGGFLTAFDDAKREAIYKSITAEKFRIAARSFDENSELYDFLSRVQSEVKSPGIAAEIGLWRLLALRGALAAIPFEQKQESQYKGFTDKYSINIVYSEPSGEWYVRSDRFWTLSKRYQALPIAERIAWEAANNPLPGECEGYLNCYLFGLRVTYGEYLERYPKGGHAAEALKAVDDQLQPIAEDARKKEIYTTPADVSDRAEFYKQISELRTIVSRTGFYEKEVVLRQLDKIAEGFR